MTALFKPLSLRELLTQLAADPFIQESEVLADTFMRSYRNVAGDLLAKALPVLESQLTIEYLTSLEDSLSPFDRAQLAGRAKAHNDFVALLNHK